MKITKSQLREIFTEALSERELTKNEKATLGTYTVGEFNDYIEPNYDRLDEKKAEKDFDKDGDIESPEAEYKGVKDKAIKKAMSKKEEVVEEAIEESLWDNINAKRKSGRKPARKGSKAYKAAVAAGKKLMELDASTLTPSKDGKIEPLKEAGEKTAFVKTAGGQSKTIEYKDEKELTNMKDNSDIKTIDTAGGKKVKENTVKDSLGEELAIGDVLEVKGRRFMVKESENGICLATMEGKCVMDVADPKARTIFENSKRVMDESYEPTSPHEPVLSVGHIDDEPGMLKQTAYDIVKYGADLYKILMHYEAMNAHVDLPHWLQAKIVLARDYVSKATHYLEYETIEPKISRHVDPKHDYESYTER